MNPPPLSILLFLLYALLFYGCHGEDKTNKQAVALKKPAPAIKKKSSPKVDSTTCLHTDLSKTFDFITRFKWYGFGAHEPDSFVVELVIINKASQKIVDEVRSEEDGLLDPSELDSCNNVRSFITGKNMKVDVDDGDYGGLVIADLNFDSKEDIALIKNIGADNGAQYNFYIQGEDGHFRLDKFLSDTMIWFPQYINTKKQTLTTLVHASAIDQGKTTFKFDKAKNRWKEIRHIYIPY